MRKFALIMFSALLMLTMSLSLSASADDKDNRLPRLTSISFKNATIDGSFDCDVMNYTITLEDNSVSPTLESYESEGECQLFIGYSYNEAKQQIGITATIEYPTGSTIYTFTYSNPAQYEKNSNNLLADLSCNTYSELVPQLNENDTEYTLYIPHDVTNIVMYPVSADTNAYCSQSPVDVTMNEGQETSVTIECIASDSSKRQYTVNIVRAQKTVDEVREEFEKDGEYSLVKGTRFYEKPEFLVITLSVIVGIIVLVLLYKLTRRIALDPVDSDEQPFFDEEEARE